jgi:hypothetical protein
LQRYEYQIQNTAPNQVKRPPQKASWENVRLGLIMLRNIFWQVGVLGDYKLEFWKFALRRLARGEIEHLIASMIVAHHLIMFARAASRGRQNASNYSMRLREASVPAE